MSYNIDGVTVTERGWAGHFISADKCRFRRNTLLEYKSKKWVISTVGDYVSSVTKTVDTIACHCYYETIAFEAKYEKPYWEADVTKILSFDSNNRIDHCEYETDLEADNMHNTVVNELIQKIKTI